MSTRKKAPPTPETLQRVTPPSESPLKRKRDDVTPVELITSAPKKKVVTLPRKPDREPEDEEEQSEPKKKEEDEEESSEESESERDSECSEEDEELEFDPYVFMKHLPPKHLRQSYAVLPPKTKNLQKTLVLDLDETLVHSKMEPIADPDFVFRVDLCDSRSTVYVKARPYLDEFLLAASKLFEIVIFTASHRAYAHTLLDHIDPNGNLLDHRLYRDSCTNVDGLYLKDLDRLGRDLASTTIVDNTPYVFAYQPDNAIPVDSWYDDPDDTTLLELLDFLQNDLLHANDVRPLLQHTFNLRAKIQAS